MVSLAPAAAATWQATVSDSYTYTVSAQILDPWFRPVPTPRLPLSDVRVDASTDPGGGWSGSFKIPLIDEDGYDWRPTDWRSPLTPYGNRVRLSMAVTADDGTTTTTVLATLLIVRVEVRRPEQSITVTLDDCLSEVAQYNLIVDFPGVLSQDKSPREIANMILSQARIPSRPQISGANDPGQATRVDTPWRWGGGGRVFNAGTSALDAVQDIVRLTNAANLVQTDRMGRLIVTQTGNSGAPVGTVRDGDGGQISAITSTLSRSGAVNGVVVHVDDTETPDPPAESPTAPGVVVGVPEGPVPPSMEQALREALMRKVLQALWLSQAQLGTGEVGGSNKYMQAYSIPAGADWCDVFVTWILDQVGAKAPDKYGTWRNVMFYVDSAVAKIRSLGHLRTSGPIRVMDVVFFTWQHVGFAEDVSTQAQGWITTIEGNSGERVQRNRTPVANLRGWYTPNWIGL